MDHDSVHAVAATSAVARLEAWFAENGWQAFDFQREVWNAYLEGGSGLVHSATGTGKTLAAWLAALAEWMAGDAPRVAGFVDNSDARPCRRHAALASACDRRS